MLTAGHQLTSTVDPEGDTAVRLGQVRSFEAVFILEPAVRSLVGRRRARRHIGGGVAVAKERGEKS